MSCKIKNHSNYDITDIKPLVQDLYGFANQRFGFKKPPVINFVSDSQNHHILGKTAHYDPNTMEIVIYTDGRHPKDMMRSIAHELVHHSQNEKGLLSKTDASGVGYAQKDPHLRKMEKEAYLKGNMCFRDWEDGYKSKNKDIYYERRIYKMSTKKWKNKELNTLLNERWGFSMNLDKLSESREITHMCALHVTHKKSGKEGHPIKHTLSESGDISHYTVEFDDVIVENIAVENLDILQMERHQHKRDDEKEHDKDKPLVSEEELEENAFTLAADAARDAGKKEFEFGGKVYPVTIKQDIESGDSKKKVNEQQMDTPSLQADAAVMMNKALVNIKNQSSIPASGPELTNLAMPVLQALMADSMLRPVLMKMMSKSDQQQGLEQAAVQETSVAGAVAGHGSPHGKKDDNNE